MTEPGGILFVGLGSPHGDDRVGWSVAEELERLAADLPGVSVRKANVPLDLIDWLDGVGQLHVCDACCGGDPVGRLIRLEALPSNGHVALELSEIGSSKSLAEIAETSGEQGQSPELLRVRLPFIPQYLEQVKPDLRRAGGSHDFGVCEVLDLAARLGRLPEKVVVHLVSGCRFEPGAGIIDELAACVPGIARTILEELTDARDVPGAVAAESG